VPFPRELLTDDEELVLDLRPHWWYITPASVYLGLAVLLGLVALLNDWPDAGKVLIGLVVLVALGYFAKRYSEWATTNFVVTNERVVSRMGVVAKKGIEIPLERINNINFFQGLWERIIGAGDLEIQSAGESGTTRFSNVRHPDGVQQEVYRQMEHDATRDAGRGAEAVGRAVVDAMEHQGAQGPQTVPEQIEALARLRDQGHITPAEYEKKKAELLEKM
jgi:uncharacterized membrane protein YdbT with pleckstrin-like domain